MVLFLKALKMLHQMQYTTKIATYYIRSAVPWTKRIQCSSRERKKTPMAKWNEIAQSGGGPHISNFISELTETRNLNSSIELLTRVHILCPDFSPFIIFRFISFHFISFGVASNRYKSSMAWSRLSCLPVQLRVKAGENSGQN